MLITQTEKHFSLLIQVQVIIWDTTNLTSVGSHCLHHANVAAVGVSPNDLYVASAGGQDDPTILIWDIQGQTPVCGKKNGPLT